MQPPCYSRRTPFTLSLDPFYYDPGLNFSFHTSANYVPPAPPAPVPTAPILPPVYHTAPPVHHVPTTAQLPMQHQPMPHLVPPSEPLPDDANYLHTCQDSVLTTYVEAVRDSTMDLS